MKKISIISLIISLILFTAFIKNSTKRIDDEIYIVGENIRSLKKEFESIKLEYEYLSSAEKLLKFQNLYFDNELMKKDIERMMKIEKKSGNFNIGKLKIINE